jgi:hypothetical protein
MRDIVNAECVMMMKRVSVSFDISSRSRQKRSVLASSRGA